MNTVADLPVWISVARNGISFHQLAEGSRRTRCGRYIGRGPDQVDHGHVLPLGEVVERFGSKACRVCVEGTGVQPRVSPSRGRT